MLRPLKGGKNGTVQPIIRSVHDFDVVLSPINSEWNQVISSFNANLIQKPVQPLIPPHPPTASGARNLHSQYGTSGNSDLINIYINPKGRSIKNYETISGVLGRGKNRQRTSSANPGKKHNTSVSFCNASRINDPASHSVIEPEVILGKNIKWSNSDTKEKAQIIVNPRGKITLKDKKKQIPVPPAQYQTISASERPKNTSNPAGNKQISFLFVKKPNTAVRIGRVNVQPPVKRNIFNFNIHA